MAMSKAPSFDDFWRAYPLHKAKVQAERAWNRLTARDKQKALASLPVYRKYCLQKGIAYKYAQGWLNDRRWEDEYEDNIPSYVAVPDTIEQDSRQPNSVPNGNGMEKW